MDEATRRDIDKAVWRLLRDAGEVKPPVHTEILLEHLDLHREFYDLQDPNFIDRAKHKLRVELRKIRGIFRKLDLKAVLFQDENRIVLDQNLPATRRDHPSCHEITHRIIPWHKAYFFGDTAQTLDPDWHEVLEEEANYGASAMRFCGPVFTRESRDTTPGWSAVEVLYKRYGKSLLATLRRYVKHGPKHPMVLVVSTPPWMAKPADQVTRCRHFIRSLAFEACFRSVGVTELLGRVDANVKKRRGGPVGSFTCALADDRGSLYEFVAEAFFNQYYVLTLFVCKKIMGKRAAIVVPA